MKTYSVKVTLNLPFNLEIEANSEQEAINKVFANWETQSERYALMQQYCDEIYLDAEVDELISEDC